VDLALLTLAAFAAGFIDSVVGGGGLIQVPALFVCLPPPLAAQVPAILGTNKFSSTFGTAVALAQYARTTKFSWAMALPAALAASVFSIFGARTVSLLSKEAVRPLILFLLIGIAVYTFAKKDFGKFQRPGRSAQQQLLLGLTAGAAIGFYDGFFGPGTGSFLIFAFVSIFGMMFLEATAHAKIVNLATNIAALSWFVAHGQVFYEYAVPMACANIFGGYLGARLAVLKGSHFVRRLFLGLVLFLIGRFAYELWRSPV